MADLPVPVAVEEDGALRTDRRAKLVEQTITDHQVGERLADRVVMDLWTLLLGLHHGRVLAQRNRCRSRVSHRVIRSIACSCPSSVTFNRMLRPSRPVT